MNFDFFKMRYELLSRLDKIYPIRLQAQNKSIWTTYFDLLDLVNGKYYYAPSIHYTLLPCEVVIEIGSLDPNNFATAIRVLKQLGIFPTIGFSGNRSWHLHFLIKPKSQDISLFCDHPLARKFTFEVFKQLVLFLKQSGVERIDTQPMYHGRIRSFYSRHPSTNNYKLPIQTGVVGDYPYFVWTISSVWFDLLDITNVNESMHESNDLSSDDLEKALEKLEPYKKRETSAYIYYTCPFHPPDTNPSFTFIKKKKIFKDWHDNKKYTAKHILSKIRD